ncbi:Branched-chain-amino-acid aminotransferase, mitochondrial [Pteropus alecto]|uniref:branched-chain-amino-acid transaminase n=1 Tax=Pteropus alecto TaxID=9402 RepID=L5L4B1_PTEAL|nr:Branched-chain-amino-acid aminotransferase, mitochondrial [Pteropus alecto]
MTQEPHKKPDASEPLVFGKTFTDHMLMVEWAEKEGWGQPRIQPFQNLTLHPACSALHYSQQVARRPTSVPDSLCVTSFSLRLSPRPLPGSAFLCVSSFCALSILFLRLLTFQALCRVTPGA